MRRGVVAVVTAGLLVACGGSSDDTAADLDAELTAPVPDSADCPARDHLAAEFHGRRRSGVEPPIDYSFLEVRPGGCQPVRFNPCEPIHYVLNTTLAPPGAVEDLEAAIEKVEVATGMTFVNDGLTDEPGSANRDVAQTQRYGNRWAPVLVVWDHGGKYEMASDNPAGGRSFQVDGVLVSGVLIVNVDTFIQDGGSGRPENGFGPGASWGRIFLHELGHVVGLGHVARSDQIMFSELGVQRGQAEFHAGDLAGLRLVGREAGCVATPSPPTGALRR
jgi:hypothetical protein